ncbi:hypothetical protein [Streptomyces sp. AF1A]|uniref:hypothetical protein n=1 Tax=Streptomyces sp. AF1A TaxID=3394350 RepID=UPI0039BC9A9D
MADSITRALNAGTAPEATRRAIADAVNAVYVGAACAAAPAFLVLLLVPAPRRFPVRQDQHRPAADGRTPSAG